MSTCVHHFILDSNNRGICKNCGEDKQFPHDPSLPKMQRKYWEISYEKLRDETFKEDEDEGDYD